jgi:hypothetical protein
MRARDGRQATTRWSVFLRNHLSPKMAAANAATATTGLMRLIAHPLCPAIPGGSLRLQSIPLSQQCM